MVTPLRARSGKQTSRSGKRSLRGRSNQPQQQQKPLGSSSHNISTLSSHQASSSTSSVSLLSVAPTRNSNPAARQTPSPANSVSDLGHSTPRRRNSKAASAASRRISSVAAASAPANHDSSSSEKIFAEIVVKTDDSEMIDNGDSISGESVLSDPPYDIDDVHNAGSDLEDAPADNDEIQINDSASVDPTPSESIQSTEPIFEGVDEPEPALVDPISTEPRQDTEPIPEKPSKPDPTPVKAAPTSPILFEPQEPDEPELSPEQPNESTPAPIEAVTTELTHAELDGPDSIPVEPVPCDADDSEASTSNAGDVDVQDARIIDVDAMDVKADDNNLDSAGPDHADLDDAELYDTELETSRLDDTELVSFGPASFESERFQSPSPKPKPLEQIPLIAEDGQPAPRQPVPVEPAKVEPAPETDHTGFEHIEPGTDEQVSTNPTPSVTATPVPAPSQPADVDSAHIKSAISHLIQESRASFASSSSNLSDHSDLSSILTAISSKATTPVDIDSSKDAPTRPTPLSTTRRRATQRRQYDVRPRVSVPTELDSSEYALQCIEAAEGSRLNPFALHQEEYLLLREHISHAHVTTYLNIRNGILRLWLRNPQIPITREEAVGCARDPRWFDVANVCFEWLVRRGYINFGCVEITSSRPRSSLKKDSPPRKRKTIAIIGAGMSGLGCARQLEGLFLQYAECFHEMGEDPPLVVVLEGRNRIGGRVHSREFRTEPDAAMAIFRDKRFTAEMGGMIITGFERGNPLNVLVRGQLGLSYHALRARTMDLYDTNGKPVKSDRDKLVQHLYNAILEYVSEYKFKTPTYKLIEGNHDLIHEGRDSSSEQHKTIALIEETTAAQPNALPISEQNTVPPVSLVPVSTDRATGKIHTEPGIPGSTRAAFKAKSLGWTLKAGVTEEKDIDLDAAAADPNATLGSVMDEAWMQHKDILDLTPQDFRIFNWDLANLEYSNATHLYNLSLKGWDIDNGNEWDGSHTMVTGGYQSVPKGLLLLPTPLHIQHKAVVKRISYTSHASTGPAKIECENGQSIEADCVVNTMPLGVLKHGSVEFHPPLPAWKTGPIERLGFGVLNKVILVYKEAFWDNDRDIFAVMRDPSSRDSMNQKDYQTSRGRFSQWFNITNTTGMPCLLALMAGDAGYDVEKSSNDDLIKEATEVLRMRFGAKVTQPIEVVITRWASDKFTRGSYSSPGINMEARDYDVMAQPVGNMFFAGEHTTIQYPATVHGAYLSGLRAASEVLEALIGPIEVPRPLIIPRETSDSLKRKAQEENRDPSEARLEAYEMEIWEHIHAKIGYRPIKPAKVAGNAYFLYNKAKYDVGRKKCEEGRRARKSKPSPNEVRAVTSKMWKDASAEDRKPFEDHAEEQKRLYNQAVRDWEDTIAKWETEARNLRVAYEKEHPSIPSEENLAFAANPDKRRRKKVESYAESDVSDGEMTW